MKHLIAALFSLALSATVARADSLGVPFILSNQGRLLDAADAPIRDARKLTFQIHETDNAQVKNPLWSEERDVSFQNGAYAVTLGDTRPGRGGTAIPATLLQKPELYLSVVIDGAEMLPRMRIPSAPYALRAGRAAFAESVLENGVDTAALKDGAVTLAKLALADGKFAGLNADQLDGLDASAFAPAAIEGKIDTLVADTTSLKADATTLKGDTTTLKDDLAAVKTSVGAGLRDAVVAASGEIAAVKATGTETNTKVGQVATSLTTVGSDAAAAKTSASDAASTASAIRTAIGTPPTSSSIAAELAALRTIAARKYSRTCRNSTDNWVNATYGSEDECLRDGRWHEVYSHVVGTADAGSMTVAQLTALAQAGGAFKVTRDGAFDSWPVQVVCEMVSDNASGSLECGARRKDESETGGGDEYITYFTSGRRCHNMAGACSATEAGRRYRWWVQF